MISVKFNKLQTTAHLAEISLKTILRTLFSITTKFHQYHHEVSSNSPPNLYFLYCFNYSMKNYVSIDTVLFLKKQKVGVRDTDKKLPL